MRRVLPVAVSLQRGTSGIESFGLPAEVAGNQSYFRLSDNAPGASERLFVPRRAPPAAANPRAGQIAQLCHCDPTKRQGSRIFAQRHPLERAEWIACCRARAAAVISESIASLPGKPGC